RMRHGRRGNAPRTGRARGRGATARRRADDRLGRGRPDHDDGPGGRGLPRQLRVGRFRMSAGPEVISLGCRLNIAESERIRAMLAGEHDVVVVNSCAVTAEAVRTTRQAIRKARRERPDARLLVTGCAAEVEREQLAAMPEVDGLVANTRKLDRRAWNAPERAPPVPVRRTRAFVAVQNGCDH